MKRFITIVLIGLLATVVAQGQITIGGNIYGGGNAGDMTGNTNVTIYAGELNEVYGGARMANVGGSAFVHIDGEHASGNIFISTVYGGNDIAGTIGTEGNTVTLPTELSEVGTGTGKSNVDGSWNAFVRTSQKQSPTTSLVVGSMFGGGNGDYTYDTQITGEGESATTTYIAKVGDTEVASSANELKAPELGKTYLEIMGGCIAHLYGGGNNATVTKNTTICINNDSPVLTETNVWPVNPTPQALAALAQKVKLSTFQSKLDSYDFNFARVFGGNNKAEMAIRPTWNLQKGIIRDLYSGGNQGAMTSKVGLLLEIDPQGTDAEKNKLKIENVYGGCRMADVHPLLSGTLSGSHVEAEEKDIQLPDPYKFPAGLAARVLVRGGDINNVYGGNDITGKVYGGNAIGIYTTIRGDVYGGGNGSYAYTDNATLGQQELFKDFYYGDLDHPFANNAASVEALNAYRPNAEQVSIRLKGEEGKPTVILGSVYCGGNSATIMTEKTDPMVELKIGSHVIADNVFLGNNGANMVDKSILQYYAGYIDATGGVLKDNSGNLSTTGGTKYSNLSLTDETTFASYMGGAAMALKPSVVFDQKPRDPDNYDPYTSYIGSFFCGGNVGSMTKAGKLTINFDDEIIVYNKVVGGCNNANVPVQYINDNKIETNKLNTGYKGGLTGTPETPVSPQTIGDKLELNFGGLKIQPMRLKKDNNGDYVYGENGSPELEWNTVSASSGENVAPVTSGATEASPVSSIAADLDRRLKGGNIYGGCYNSGHVNGNVVINLNETIHERDKIFDVANNEGDKNYENVEKAEENANYYHITKRNSGVLLSQQGTDVFGKALNVFGGGFGENSEIWGSTTINLNKGYTFQIFGGGEMGAIGQGKRLTDGTLSYDKNNDGKVNDADADAAYSTTINLTGATNLPGVARGAVGDSDDMAECEYIYGGAYEGLIQGDSHVYLGNGRIFDSFGGSCNANILGHVETYIGSNGFPYVRDYVYGGNDLGGKVFGNKNYTENIRSEVAGMVDDAYNEQVKKVTAYTEYTQGRVDYIIGGSSGNYNYNDPAYKVGTGDDCTVASKPYIHNTFVNFRPNSTSGNEVAKVFGAGEGCSGDRDGDALQDHSYVLIDIPTGVENFATTEVFGAGAFNGLGMGYTPEQTFDTAFDLNEASAIVDLMRGKIGAAYGGSYEEGITRRTVVNVPVGSTIDITNIFGGAFGTNILPPCDVYESNVNYRSNEATVTGAIYGGNNNERRTLYAHVNIFSPVWSNEEKGYLAKVYGAGKGKDTWSEYTEVNLWNNAKVYEVYGGGEMGHVLNGESVMKYMQTYVEKPSDDIAAKDPKWSKDVYWVLDGDGNKQNLKTGKLNENDEKTIPEMWADDWREAWTFGEYYASLGEYTRYASNTNMNLSNSHEVRTAEMDDRDYTAYETKSGDSETVTTAKTAARDRTDHKYNTNVIIHKGATVEGYAYGGGLGEDKTPLSGDVYGTTYIALLGGTVTKDIYAAGTTGAVYDLFGVGSFDASTNSNGYTASANAYIKGGSTRNVYGGGWKGSVGYHNGGIEADYYVTTAGTDYGKLLDIPGETHVVIGILKDDLPANPKTPEQEGYDPNFHFYNGIPVVERNAYGGGEGGAVWGTANITMNNGYIGYTYNKNGTNVAATANIDERYEEKIVDDTYKDEDGHFQDNKRLSDAGCIFGGGYIDNSSVDFTKVTMYGGHVRNALFGGGEIAAIGRGIIQETTGTDGKKIRTLQGIYRPGGTDLEMFDGHVHRNVFGGGRGYNNLGESGSLFSDGYVFGQTKVHIHGGEIGTLDELNKGNGNVFGGGDIGYVYSAYEYDDGQGHKLPRKGVKSGVRYDGDGMYQGYYYEHDWADDAANTAEANKKFIKYLNGVESTTGTERKLTEDCEVLIAPSCKLTATSATYPIKYYKGQVLSDNDLRYIQTEGTEELKGKIDAFGKVTAEGGISMNRTFYKGEYVPTSALNTLGNKEDTKWGDLEANTNDDGIIIHNALFAGGNTTKGADNINAFAGSYSVYGNVTASIHDVYHRDLITIGTGHIGGLYGDGNLTLVDGYRGLNITNYGTDYHYLYEEEGKSEMSIDDYNHLLDREQDYYELRYKCIKECKDMDGTTYHPEGGDYTKASTLTLDDILTLFPATVPTPNPNNYSVPVGLYNTDGSLNEGEGAYWKQNGVCSIYAGRILNTIQRADFCGVFGSRMVMQGAQDRVPEVVDYTKYTINRVREVSLNKKKSVIQADINQSDASSNKYRFRKQHGNYFGIYNIVNYLGAMTSDVDFGDQGTSGLGSGDTEDAAGRITKNDGTFDYYTSDTTSHGDVRTSDNIDTGTYGPQYTGQTFYGWKRFHHDDRDRNNGNSHNKVALASGVYLELTTEESTGKDLYEKVWGPITGVVELDLINVQQGMGGGFVYAKNIHGKRTKTNLTNTTLTALNAGAVTRWDYTYEEPSTTSDSTDLKQREWQTSGNFVHSTQTIIDDCYNVSNRYKGANRVPAHYWYIKGSVYVYDQYISAYTGATNAYSEKVDIPLTITAASHGKMKLLNVQPNRYAYRNTNGEKLSGDQKLIINDIEYKLNDPIAYWDWYKLTPAERGLFEPETYVSTAKYKYSQEGADVFPADAVLLPTEYTTIMSNAHKEPILDGEGNQLCDEDNNPLYEAQLWDVEREKYVQADSIIRLSNNLSHDTGYILTYRVNNPTEWDTWYTEYLDASNNTSAVREKSQDLSQLVSETVNNIQKGPNEGPTYRLKSGTGELLGQRSYKISDLISKDVETTYQTMKTGHSTEVNAIGGQATFQRAWVATGETDIQRGTPTTQTVHLYKGSTMSETEKSTASVSGNVAEAFVCTKTIKLDGTNSIYINSVMTESEKTTHLGNVNTAIGTLVDEINEKLDESNKITAANISKIGDLTTAQLNKMTALQKKNLSDLLTRKKDITDCVVPAYYCTTAGLYGGNYYEGGINYRGLEAWSSMDEKDRDKFIFNYDALDLLIDPTYDNNDASKEGKKYQYDGATYNAGIITPFTTSEQAGTNDAGYSLEQHVNYTATYNGSTNDSTDVDNKKYLETNVVSGGKVYIGDELTREQFEQLPNEQRHYAPITVTTTDLGTNGTCTFYIVKEPLLIGPTPYTAGNIISKADYDGLSETEQTKVTPKSFNAAGTYYFCREAYGNVTIGTFITSTDYNDLTNYQKGFTIHGIAPTETSTLYVSRFSDIDDLSKEKIITVIYEYNYEESDVSGLHITPVTERHVLNIHINFKTGAPIVEDISAPRIILPGELLSLLPPNVIEGASPVQGGGWELYPTDSDADNHNGVEYVPDTDPLYWYQNGYWLRYYALSYVGGKTYSNKVQVSVANYHDLKEVMEDKQHHYYIDIPDLNRLRDPKIYINDGTNGAQQLKDLFDLSLLKTTPTGDLAGHALLDEQVEGCQNLEFFMRTNVNHTGEWTPIANNNDECFAGTLHGDGHYISGLSGSLFNHLCGSVYNLGVTGSFTTSGVADAGKPSGMSNDYHDGFVENCWISTSSTEAKTKKPVFGIESGSGKRIVNSYYQEEDDATNKYTNHSGDYGIPTRKTAQAFYNGEVAYDLNGFYLYKRYFDQKAGTAGSPYKYYIAGVTDPTTNRLDPKTEYYESNITYCSSGAKDNDNTLVYPSVGYVEDRYADGDFRYAIGEIPETVEERLYTDTQDGNKPKFYPIWPDDYLFFGQMLTYGWNESRPHEDVPSPIVKDNGRLHDTDLSNRVFRAPAYYRSSDMSVVHYNPWAYLAAKSADGTKDAYPYMTAVDFAGHGESAHQIGSYKTAPYDIIDQLPDGAFYPPLLDDDGLIGVANNGETKNLLVYAPSATANQQTYNVLNGYFIGTSTSRTEPVYSEHTESGAEYNDGKEYGRVAPASIVTINGHLVQSNLKTTTDHLLVDKAEFNCPIGYDMGNGYRMWYQRTPDNFVDLTEGWEGISLPFTAELVTTNEKGELTHFYEGSTKGHEYWLREYTGHVTPTGETDVYADFNPMAAGSNTKDYTNTFLWDYYYSKNSYLDKNTDEYQKQYYSSAYLSRLYPVSNYPYPQAGTPYLVGFPGETYYEFDLSGGWTPSNRYKDQTIASKGKQTITFVSEPGTTINVSDGEMAGVTKDDYTFKPNYLKETLIPVGQGDSTMPRCYYLNDSGNAFVDEGTGEITVWPFRPYFETENAGRLKKQNLVRRILFEQDENSFEFEDNDPRKKEVGGELIFYVKGVVIGVKSTLSQNTDVLIVNTSGQTIGAFTVHPDETIETPVPNTGVYIVRAAGGKFNKKVTVR